MAFMSMGKRQNYPVTVVTFVVELDKPDAPENLTLKDSTESSVTLKWEVPPSDGGAPITQYVVERREPSKRAWTAAGTAPADRLELTVNGLVEGQAYSFRVAAENSCGVGEFAEMQKPVSPRSQFGQLAALCQHNLVYRSRSVSLLLLLGRVAL